MTLLSVVILYFITMMSLVNTIGHFERVFQNYTRIGLNKKNGVNGFDGT